MNLSQRLRDIDETAPRGLGTPETRRPLDVMSDFKNQVNSALYAGLGNRLFDASLTEEQLRGLISQEIARLMQGMTAPLSVEERQTLSQEIVDDILGVGPIEVFMKDPTVSEVMVNGPDNIYVERHGVIETTSARFVSEEHLRQVIDRIAARVGRRVDESSPMVDARLADGSRVNAVLPPVSIDGPSLTIRKFSRDIMGVKELIKVGTLSPELAEVLDAAVRGALTIIVSGGTGTGKTTLLNVLSGSIPETERIVTIEDAVELQLRQRHVVRLESRTANVEGRGEITIRDLVRNALRMRPDRIIVGEVRGGEALDMLQAINTGHDGSLSTVHANTPRDALRRLETMVLMAGFDLPIKVIREQIASGVDLVVQLSRLRDGSRRITQVSEVTGMEGDVISLTDLFVYEYANTHGTGPTTHGTIVPTGAPAKFVEKLAERDVILDQRLFGGGRDPIERDLGGRRRGR